VKSSLLGYALSMDSQSTDQLEPQTDSSEPKRREILGWLLLPFILVLLYALSVGPAMRLMEEGHLPGWPVLNFYAPLDSATRVYEPAHRLLVWYVNVWHPKPPPDWDKPPALPGSNN
jgi:hypothetical protein